VPNDGKITAEQIDMVTKAKTREAAGDPGR
jgi:hypothetical protein